MSEKALNKGWCCALGAGKAARSILFALKKQAKRCFADGTELCV